MKRSASRWSIPGVLALSACPSPEPSGSDAGTDAGPAIDAGPLVCNYDAGRTYIAPTDAGCPHPDTIDARGVRCACIACDGDGGCVPGTYDYCCDDDIGNPCPVCQASLHDADGGRRYLFYSDGACEPVCFT
jgi:hypothetical protein